MLFWKLLAGAAGMLTTAGAPADDKPSDKKKDVVVTARVAGDETKKPDEAKAITFTARIADDAKKPGETKEVRVFTRKVGEEIKAAHPGKVQVSGKVIIVDDKGNQTVKVFGDDVKVEGKALTLDKGSGDLIITLPDGVVKHIDLGEKIVKEPAKKTVTAPVRKTVTAKSFVFKGDDKAAGKDGKKMEFVIVGEGGNPDEFTVAPRIALKLDQVAKEGKVDLEVIHKALGELHGIGPAIELKLDRDLHGLFVPGEKKAVVKPAGGGVEQKLDRILERLDRLEKKLEAMNAKK